MRRDRPTHPDFAHDPATSRPELPAVVLGTLIVLAAAVLGCGGGGGGGGDAGGGGDQSDGNAPAGLTVGDVFLFTSAGPITSLTLQTETLAVVDSGGDSGIASVTYSTTGSDNATLTIVVLPPDDIGLNLIGADFELAFGSPTGGTLSLSAQNAVGNPIADAGSFTFIDN